MRKEIISVLLLGLLLVVGVAVPSLVFAEKAIEKKSPELKKLEGEILEVEELKTPQRAAIYTIRDLASGVKHRFFAHPYRTVIQIGDEPRAVTDVVSGSKIMIIYRDSTDSDTPEIVFGKVTVTFYS